MNKLEMAHQWAMKHGKSDTIGDRLNMVKYAWDYADAMQAEDDKRNPKGFPDVLKVADSPQLNNESVLHDIDCYFDNAKNTKRDADNLIQSIYEHLTGEVKTNAVIEWQPDWSQAPSWAVAWAMDMSGECYWHSGSKEPKVDNHIFESSADGHTFEAPSFGYKGNWQDSLRKRPNT